MIYDGLVLRLRNWRLFLEALIVGGQFGGGCRVPGPWTLLNITILTFWTLVNISGEHYWTFEHYNAEHYNFVVNAACPSPSLTCNEHFFLPWLMLNISWAQNYWTLQFSFLAFETLPLCHEYQISDGKIMFTEHFSSSRTLPADTPGAESGSSWVVGTTACRFAAVKQESSSNSKLKEEKIKTS